MLNKNFSKSLKTYLSSHRIQENMNQYIQKQQRLDKGIKQSLPSIARTVFSSTCKNKYGQFKILTQQSQQQKERDRSLKLKTQTSKIRFDEQLDEIIGEIIKQRDAKVVNYELKHNISRRNLKDLRITKQSYEDMIQKQMKEQQLKDNRNKFKSFAASNPQNLKSFNQKKKELYTKQTKAYYPLMKLRQQNVDIIMNNRTLVSAQFIKQYRGNRSSKKYGNYK